MNRIYRQYRTLMRAHNRTLFFLEIVSLYVLVVFLIPFVNRGIEYVMRLKGFSYITSQNVLSFLVYPPTILLFLILLLLISFIILLKMIAAIYYCVDGPKKNHSLIRILFHAIAKSLRCIFTGNILIPFFAILLYIYINIPLLIGFIINTPLHMTTGLIKEGHVKGFFLLLLFLMGFIAFRGMFSIHYYIYENKRWKDAFTRSKELLKGRMIKTVLKFVMINLGLALGIYVIYYLVLFVTSIFVYLFADRNLIVASFLSLYPKINLMFGIFYNVIAFIVNINFVSTLFIKYQKEVYKDQLPVTYQLPEIPLTFQSSKNKTLIKVIIIALILSGSFNFYLTIYNNSLYLKEALSVMKVSSHRGNSVVAPENTMPAIENAISALSDYVELDVRQTKDGVLVLMHDKSLRRTAGVNAYVWDLTYEETQALDVGSWFGTEFADTKIPTLEEALAYCKGKIKLNIEIKINGKENDLEKNLVDLIELYDFEHQCVVTSFHYTSLIKIKQYNPNIRTGYIMSAAYGNFYIKDYVDFFSIKSSFITKKLVQTAHEYGKEVHAWTVNSVDEIERMKSVGVNCIITDNPTLAKEIIYRNDSNIHFIRLLNEMLNNRSFYRF